VSAPKILVFAGSLRTGSLNRRLAGLAAAHLEAQGAAVTRLDLADHPLPLYDANLEGAEGVPAGGQVLHELFRTHHGVFIASPEYNANIPPLLVNVLAWVSRVSDHGGMAAAFGRPVFALGSASPGAFGGYRGLMVLRQMLTLQLMARVLPPMASVAAAHEAFDEAGGLRNPRSNQMLTRVVAQLVEAAGQGAARGA